MRAFVRSSVLNQARQTSSSVHRDAVRGIQTSNFKMTGTQATPYKMHIVPEDSGLWKTVQTEAAAKKVSALLQEDLEVGAVFK